MTHRFLRNGRRTIHFTVSIIFVLIIQRGRTQDFFAGARGGASSSGTAGNRHFYQAEFFGGYDFHCRLTFSKWFLQPGVDGSVGWISDGDTSAFIGTIGPFVELGRGRFPITLEGGVAPTFLSQHRFESRDFGDNFQFTTRVGLNWRMSEHFTLGFSFQHMSNAGITHRNPGLNLEFLSLRYNF